MPEVRAGHPASPGRPRSREDREVDACPVCEGRDFYVRKDLNRTLGLAAVVVVGLISVGFLWSGREGLAYGVLGAFALVDFVVYQLLKDVTVCYRCQAEFRGSYRRTASAVRPAHGGAAASSSTAGAWRPVRGSGARLASPVTGGAAAVASPFGSSW